MERALNRMESYAKRGREEVDELREKRNKQSIAANRNVDWHLSVETEIYLSCNGESLVFFCGEFCWVKLVAPPFYRVR